MYEVILNVQYLLLLYTCLVPNNCGIIIEDIKQMRQSLWGKYYERWGFNLNIAEKRRALVLPSEIIKEIPDASSGVF
jgi:hypothetical protein